MNIESNAMPEEIKSPDNSHAPYHFNSMFKYRINYVPIDSRERVSRWGGERKNGVYLHALSKEQIEEIICSGEINEIRELSRYYYRTNGRYRGTIDFLAALPLYDTIVTPIYETGKGSKA